MQLLAVHKNEEENFYGQHKRRERKFRRVAVQKNSPALYRGVFSEKVLLGFYVDVFFCHQFGKFTLAHVADGNDPPFLLFAGSGFAAFPADD